MIDTVSPSSFACWIASMTSFERAVKVQDCVRKQEKVNGIFLPTELLMVLIMYVRTNGPVGKTICHGKFNPGPRINLTSAYVVFVVISIPVKKSVTKVSIFPVIFPMGVWYFLGRHFSYAQLNSGCVFVLGSICWLYYKYMYWVLAIGIMHKTKTILRGTRR